MLRVCEKLREADAKRKRLGLVRTETDYLRALLAAMADMDRLVEVEVLKTLGDVNLEKGRLHKDVGKFDRAMMLYSTALLCCEDANVGESLETRYRHAEKLRLGKTTATSIDYEPSSTANKMPSLTKMAEKFQHLDRRLKFDYNKDSLLIEYTKLVVEGIANEDRMLEVEAIKSLGDVYLKRGTETRNTTCLTKATALYNTALARCEGVQGRVVLNHRLQYTARIRQEMKKNANHVPNHRRQQQQQGDVPRDFPFTSAYTDVIGQQFMSPSAYIASQTVKPPAPDDRSYEDNLTAGARALADGNLDRAEEKFASALRLIHDPNKPDRDKEAECLCRLGDIYVQRGKTTKEGRKFTQAAALYNAAMARTDTDKDKIKQSLQDTEQWFLQHTANVDVKPSPSDSAIRHQMRLEDMRARAKSKLEAIDQQHNPYQYDEDDPKMLTAEAERAEAVKALFKNIAKDRQTFIQDLVDECIATLGPPPCKYAFIGLGSQATELVTPYSDLEFAILIEDGNNDDVTRRYFLNLTHYLHLKVINLGETILPAMAIPSLNDFYSEDPNKNWFFDSVTPRGFSFDGSMPWACKTPFGRDKTKTKEPVSLIQTPAKMAEFQELEVSLAEGYHLSDILRRVVFLAGENALVNKYRKKLNKVVTSDLLSQFQSRLSAMEILRENREMMTTYEPTGQLLNVKKDIYRFPGIAVEILALCCQINLASTWAVIDRLREAGQIQRENATHLTVLTSISAELRLRTYMANKGQKDSLSPLAEIEYQTKMQEVSDSTLKSEFHIPDTQILYRYYYRAIPLKKCIPEIIKYGSQFPSKGVFKTTIFDVSHECRGRIAKNFFHSSKCIHHFEAALKDTGTDMISRSVLLVELGEYLALHGDITKAKSYFEEALMIHKGVKTLGTTANPVIAASLHSLGISWGILGDPKKAISCFEQSLVILKCIFGDSKPHPDIASALANLGFCWSDLGDKEKAISYIEQSLMMRKTIYGDTAHEHIAKSLTALGFCWSDLGNEKKAISYYEQSLTMTKTIYGQNTIHPAIAAVLNNMGLSYSKLGNQDKAASYYEQSLIIKKAIYGETACHQDIAISLHNVGLTYSKLDNHEKAVSYFEKSLMMLRAIYGENAAHLEIAISLGNLGLSWSKVGDYRKSISYCEKLIAMRKRLHGDDTPHLKIAGALEILGLCWRELGHEQKAVTFFEQSLTMWKTIHGDKTAHLEIAGALYNLGSCWSKLDDQKKAIDYSEQSLRMTKTIYGENTVHTFITLEQLGSCWSKLGDHKKAVSYFDQSLRMAKTMYGDNTAHADIAMSLYNLGSSWSKLGNEKKALSYFEQSLRMAKTFYGENTAHADIAKSLHNLGSSWSKLGNQKKAISYFEHSLRMAKTIYGDNTAHTLIAGILEQLGSSWRTLGDLQKAISYLEQSLTMERTMKGPNTADIDVARLLTNLGALWSNLGDERKAICCLEQSLSMTETLYGRNTAHEDIAGTFHNLGLCWYKLGDGKKAISYIKQSLTIRKTIYGDNTAHPDIAVSLLSLGSSWSKLSDHKKAIRYLNQSLTMMKKVYGDNTAHLHTAALLHELGSAWSKVGNHKKAIGYLDQALTMGKTFYGPNTTHPYIATTLGYLGFSWSKLGDQTKANSYLEQLHRIAKTIDRDNANPNIAASLQNLKIHMK
ncbi:uncharacterized protein LOC144883814 [Branchiostoma floridae x Branchiostoma japonicum]